MADRSTQQGRGGESSRQGQLAESPEALRRWLAQVVGISPDRMRTVDDAQGHLALARRRTDEDLAARRDDRDALNDDRLTRTEEELALIETLDGLRQRQDDQFAQFDRILGAEQRAYEDMDREREDSSALIDQLSERRDAMLGYEVELGRLYDSLDERWTEATAALGAREIVLGEVGATRDLDRLRALIAEHRGALGRTLDDLARRTEEAEERAQAARERNEEATARLQELQSEIETLGTPPEDPQDQEHAAAIAARLGTLEDERSALGARMKTSSEELDRIATALEDLATQRERVTGDIGVLDGLVDGEDSTVNRLQSIADEYKSTLQSSIETNNEINTLEQNIKASDDKIQEFQENMEDIKNEISQTQLQISGVENEIQKERNKEGALKQEFAGLDRRQEELDSNIDRLLQIAERLDSDELLRAIEQLPETLRDDTATTQPDVAGQTGPDVIGPVASTDQAPPPTREDVRAMTRAAQQLDVADGGDGVASESLLSAIRDVGKIVLRDLPVLLTFATARESAAYAISASSEKTKQDLAILLIALNFLPIAVKAGGLVYDTSASRPAEDRMVPTAKQYASLATNTLLMVGATVAAAEKGGGIAAQAPAAARALIIGLRDMANMFLPVTQNRRGDLLLNEPAVLADDGAYSTYSQLTTVLIGLGLVHSGAGAQAAGLVGAEAAKEMAKYVLAYTAVELLETISYRAFTQYFDRIARGLDPAMPGDPNARQGLQGITRYRAKVEFKLRHTLSEIRRQGTDVAHARQAFTYILLIFGNVVSELTKNQTVAASTLIQAGAFFAATFVAYFPFVGIGEYRARQE